MRFAVRALLSIFITLCIIFVLLPIPTVHAQMYTNTGTPLTASTTNMHTYTQNVFIDVIGGLGCLLGGIDVTNPHLPCVTNTGSSTTYNVRNSGLIGTFASLTGALYTPPIHTSDYTHDLASHFGFVKSAYAATGGTGVNSLNPLVTIWKVFRNIAYLIFVVIFVLVGFGIMLRFNIDPRTVMSIENQLPKLVIGLILVTFSFAIAGLLIDFMWVLTFFVINLFSGIDCQLIQNTTCSLPGVTTTNIFQNPFGFLNTVEPNGFLGIVAGVGGSIGDVIRGLFTQGNSNQLGLIPPLNGDSSGTQCNTLFICGLHDFMTGVVLNSIGSILGALLSYLISAIGMLVVLIVLLVAMFRLWFSLIFAYGFILIDILLGPFFIVFGMIPNSKVNFSSWVKDLLANLLIFPSIIAVFLLARILMDAFSTNQQSLFVPPLIGNPNGASGGGVNPLGFIFGFVAILVAPQVQMLWQGVFGIEPGKLGAAIGQSVAGGIGLIIGGAKNTGRAIMSKNEWVLGEGGKSKQRGWGQSIFGGFLR